VLSSLAYPGAGIAVTRPHLVHLELGCLFFGSKIVSGIVGLCIGSGLDSKAGVTSLPFEGK